MEKTMPKETTDKALQMDPEDIKMCNCSSCDKELLGRSMEVWWESLSKTERRCLPQMVAGSLDERPLCKKCLSFFRNQKRNNLLEYD